MDNTQLTQVIHFASEQHASVNHTYDDRPYSYHLNMVDQFALKFKDLVHPNSLNIIRAGCYCHDLIEDCRLTYNDIKNSFGFEVAEIAYALTNEKGKTRAERANEKYYQGIRENKNAHFVKICDRLANIEHSKLSGSKMFEVYKKEHIKFYSELFTPEFEPMFKYMEEQFGI